MRETRRLGRWAICPNALAHRSAVPDERDPVAEAVRAHLAALASDGYRSRLDEVEVLVAAGHRALRRRQAWVSAFLVPVVLVVAVAGFLLGRVL